MKLVVKLMEMIIPPSMYLELQVDSAIHGYIVHCVSFLTAKVPCLG